MNDLRGCQFCGAWHTPVPGRVPSETCNQCWTEINAQLMLAVEQMPPMLVEVSADSYFWVPDRMIEQ